MDIFSEFIFDNFNNSMFDATFPLELKNADVILFFFLKKGQNNFPGFYLSTFAYSRFPPKIQFLYCLLSSVILWGGPMVDTEGSIFEI